MCSCRFNYDYYVCFYLGFGNIWAHFLSRWIGGINNSHEYIIGFLKKIWVYYWHHFNICLTTCNCWVGTCYLFFTGPSMTPLYCLLVTTYHLVVVKKLWKKLWLIILSNLSLSFPFYLFLHFGWTCILSLLFLLFPMLDLWIFASGF